MALNSAECWQVAQQPIFQARVRFSLNNQARVVLAEALNTPGHAGRVEFARKVLTGQYNLEHFAMAIFTDPALKSSGNANNPDTNGLQDAEIAATVATLWNTLAGVETGV